LIGYAADGTIGRELLEKKERIIIKNKEYRRNANIEKIDVFSGHADKNGLLEFAKNQNKSTIKKIFLVHGDEPSMLDFQKDLESLGFADVICPEKNEIFNL
jgi:metallo-beta-lactamase family protein